MKRLFAFALLSMSLAACAASSDQGASEVFTGTYKTTPYTGALPAPADAQYPANRYINIATQDGKGLHMKRAWIPFADKTASEVITENDDSN